jgi:hypothetical protein
MAAFSADLLVESHQRKAGEDASSPADRPAPIPRATRSTWISATTLETRSGLGPQDFAKRPGLGLGHDELQTRCCTSTHPP